MPNYAWEGKTRQGEIRKGTNQAANEAALTAELRRTGIMPTSIRAIKENKIKFNFGGGSVTSKELVVFTRQFCTMIDAGLPLVQCLDILSKQQENPFFKKCLLAVKESVESGSTFAEALKKHPKVFDELYVNLVAAGEVGGILDTILNRLAAYIEKNLKLKKQVKSAMTYPVTIISIAALVVGVILIFVIPAFESMFASFNSALPLPTQIVINMSRGLKKYILVIIGAIWLFIFLCKRFYANPKGREMVDDYALKLPVIGLLIRKVSVAKFTRTLGTMISSGVPILDGLDIVAKTAGNRTVEKAIYQVRQSISEGKTIAEPLSKSGVFPAMVCQMIAVGEQAGAIDTMLNKIADFYDDEVDDAVSGLTAMMEPMLMAFLGTVVGGLVIAMYLPIFKLAGAA